MSLSKTYGTKLPAKLEKKFLKYVEREGLSPSRALSKAIERVVEPSPNADWYKSQLRKDFKREHGVDSSRDLHKALRKELASPDLMERIAKAVVAQLNPNSVYNGSAIDNYVPNPAEQRPNGGYPAGGEDDASLMSENEPLNSETESWQGDTGRGEDVSDFEGSPSISKRHFEEAMSSIGLDATTRRRHSKNLSKSAPTVADEHPEGFVLGNNEGTVEKSAGYKTADDYADARPPAFLKNLLDRAENEELRKLLGDSRSPAALKGMGEVIANGPSCDPEEFVKAVMATFGALKKA